MTPLVLKAIAVVTYAGVEYWLGKTHKVKENSTLAVGLKLIKSVAGIFIARK